MCIRDSPEGGEVECAGVRDGGGGVGAKDAGFRLGGRNDGEDADGRENVIRLELVIRREGVEVMNCGNMVTAMQNEMRVELAIVGGEPRVEVCGRTVPGASAEDIAKLFDDLKAGAIAALRSFAPEVKKTLDSGSEAGMTGKGAVI